MDNISVICIVTYLYYVSHQAKIICIYYLSIVILGVILLNETYSYATYLTLIPICFGVALSCYNYDSISFIGLLIASSSNICFSARAVYTKILSNTTKSFDEINLFLHISTKGLILLIPITLLFEGRSISMFLFDNIQQYYSTKLSAAKRTTDTNDFNLVSLLLLLAMNGFMFATYNLVSYLVLKRTELITHSVLNVFRRVFIISFTALYFQIPFSFLTGIGIALAVTGILLFGHCKSRRIVVADNHHHVSSISAKYNKNDDPIS